MLKKTFCNKDRQVLQNGTHKIQNTKIQSSQQGTHRTRSNRQLTLTVYGFLKILFIKRVPFAVERGQL